MFKLDPADLYRIEQDAKDGNFEAYDVIDMVDDCLKYREILHRNARMLQDTLAALEDAGHCLDELVSQNESVGVVAYAQPSRTTESGASASCAPASSPTTAPSSNGSTSAAGPVPVASWHPRPQND